MEELKTSAEWQKLCKIEVIDPDGWDRQNLQYSWFEEEITREEFVERMLPSTIRAGMPIGENMWRNKE